jgi:hypothetical protein
MAQEEKQTSKTQRRTQQQDDEPDEWYVRSRQAARAARLYVPNAFPTARNFPSTLTRIAGTSEFSALAAQVCLHVDR